MDAIAAAAPAMALAVLAWIVMGVRRPYPEGGFTTATPIAWYAHVMAVAGAVMGLVGSALAVKAAFGFANLAYSYPSWDHYSPTPLTTAGPQISRDDDLTLGITLLGVGLFVLLAHALVTRAMARLPGGSLAWISRGSLVLFACFAGIVAMVATVAAVDEGIGYSRGVGDHQFGEAAGLALFFLPAWIAATQRLLRTSPAHGAPAPGAPPRPAGSAA